MKNNIEIIYSDEALVVVNKPGGLLSVPGKGPENKDCVSSRLQTHFPDMIEQPAVHRLDMYTSGLMVYAISKEAHRNLSIQFQDKKVHKQYTAVLEGIVEEPSGEIQLHFRLDVDNRPLQIYDPLQGKLGITRWKVLSIDNGQTRIEFTPLTGRTHQLRIHAAHEKGLGCPILGDSFYGSGNDGDEMFLHATELSFSHPLTGEKMFFRSEPPF